MRQFKHKKKLMNCLYPLKYKNELRVTQRVFPTQQEIIYPINGSLLRIKYFLPNKECGRSLFQQRMEKAIDEEMEALERNHIQEMVELPRGKKTISCNWVSTPKYQANGTLERYKVKLVARGFTQSYGIDYFKTFALVAKLNTIRILISLAAHLN